MGLLTEPALDELVAAGCPACQHRVLVFRSFVDAKLPLMLGDPTGGYTWVYDGEKFVDGVYDVRCASCAHVVFTAGCCPRCHADGALAGALERENDYEVPERCPGCDSTEVTYWGMVPVEIVYDGKPAKPKTRVDMFDPGFHGTGFECMDCDTDGALTAACPLCAAPAPLRERP